MNEKIKISDLSIRIRNKTNSSPTTDSLKDFDFEMEKIDIKEFIIYNFNNQNGTWLKDLILSTFKHWKELNYSDWTYIFTNIEGNDLGKYYMNHISKTYLGIDPKFRSSKGIRERLFPKNYRQKVKTVEFVSSLNQELLELEKSYLKKNLIEIGNLITLSDKLIFEMNNSYRN